MMYFLDFDRTLFDTDAFCALAQTHPSAADKTFSSNEMLELHALSLAAGPDPAQCLYVDVPEFLRALGNEAVIVTFGDPVLQRMKVEKALRGIPRITALYTGNELKGTFLASRAMSYGARSIFVDDRPLQLESVSEHCPAIRVYEMRRDGEAGDGRWPVVHSLTELP